ncbi:MAG: hypothetical protein HC765_09115 [Brachymonas sp.]|nr:hypothetical protein [Brachymonas sp.]
MFDAKSLFETMVRGAAPQAASGGAAGGGGHGPARYRWHVHRHRRGLRGRLHHHRAGHRHPTRRPRRGGRSSEGSPRSSGSHPRAQLTPHTTTRAAPLRRLIDAARQQGFSEAHQEHELGVYALAVPLYDAQNRVVAAMNLVLTNAQNHPPQSSDALQKAYLAQMQAAAGELRLLL